MSIVVLGIICFIGIVATILYSVASHMYSVVLLRELHMRAWFSLEAGLLVAFAHIQEDQSLYIHPNETEKILYAGNWPIDHRNLVYNIKLSVLHKGNNIIELWGVLYDRETIILTVVWILNYMQEQWFLAQVRRIYVE